MNKFFQPSPIFLPEVLAVLRIITGIFLIYHGKEIFEPETMKGYLEWEMFKGSGGETKVYFGKGSEFVAGIFLLLGLFTRLGAVVVIGTFAFITFFVGSGKFWYEDQHPFMFLMLGFLFLFAGPGRWSVDERRVKSEKLKAKS